MTEPKPGWLQRQMDETRERCKLWPKDLLATLSTICGTQNHSPQTEAPNSMENPPPKPVHPLTRTYTEIYDTKSNNTKIRPKGKFFYCKECKAWQGHEITCSQVTIESIATLLTHSRDAEQHARNRAAKWLDDANRLAGRVAIFRHENNKLRKANEKLRKQNAELLAALHADTQPLKAGVSDEALLPKPQGRV